MASQDAICQQRVWRNGDTGSIAAWDVLNRQGSGGMVEHREHGGLGNELLAGIGRKRGKGGMAA